MWWAGGALGYRVGEGEGFDEDMDKDSTEMGGVYVLFMRRRGGEEGGRKDGDHHKQLLVLVTVEVSSLLF